MYCVVIISLSIDSKISYEMDLESYLEKVYYDPKSPASFSSANKLLHVIKKQNRFKNVKRNQIESWLQLQDTYTLHKPVRRKFKRNAVIVSHIDYQWDIDLMDVSNLKRNNKQTTFLLVAIDIFVGESFEEEDR